MLPVSKRSNEVSKRDERDEEGKGAIEELIRPHNLSGYGSARQC